MRVMPDDEVDEVEEKRDERDATDDEIDEMRILKNEIMQLGIDEVEVENISGVHYDETDVSDWLKYVIKQIEVVE